MNDAGAEFLRRDLWEPEQLQRIYEEAAQQVETETVDSLAAKLRGQMLAENAWYVEREPPRELARKVLANEALRSTPPGYATVRGTLDTSPGDSGSALYYSIFDELEQRHDLLYGTLSGHGSGLNYNVWHRWNEETFNFVDANSPFPSDP